jgi:hypothetical protein
VDAISPNKNIRPKSAAVFTGDMDSGLQMLNLDALFRGKNLAFVGYLCVQYTE